MTRFLTEAELDLEFPGAQKAILAKKEECGDDVITMEKIENPIKFYQITPQGVIILRCFDKYKLRQLYEYSKLDKVPFADPANRVKFSKTQVDEVLAKTTDFNMKEMFDEYRKSAAARGDAYAADLRIQFVQGGGGGYETEEEEEEEEDTTYVAPIVENYLLARLGGVLNTTREAFSIMQIMVGELQRYGYRNALLRPRELGVNIINRITNSGWIRINVMPLFSETLFNPIFFRSFVMLTELTARRMSLNYDFDNPPALVAWIRENSLETDTAEYLASILILLMRNVSQAVLQDILLALYPSWTGAWIYKADLYAGALRQVNLEIQRRFPFWTPSNLPSEATTTAALQYRGPTTMAQLTALTTPPPPSISSSSSSSSAQSDPLAIYPRVFNYFRIFLEARLTTSNIPNIENVMKAIVSVIVRMGPQQAFFDSTAVAEEVLRELREKDILNQSDIERMQNLVLDSLFIKRLITIYGGMMLARNSGYSFIFPILPSSLNDWLQEHNIGNEFSQYVVAGAFILYRNILSRDAFLILISDILKPNPMLNEHVRRISMANLEREDVYRESLDVVNSAIQQTYPNWNPNRDIGLPVEGEFVSLVPSSSSSSVSTSISSSSSSSSSSSQTQDENDPLAPNRRVHNYFRIFLEGRLNFQKVPNGIVRNTIVSVLLVMGPQQVFNQPTMFAAEVLRELREQNILNMDDIVLVLDSLFIKRLITIYTGMMLARNSGYSFVFPILPSSLNDWLQEHNIGNEASQYMVAGAFILYRNILSRDAFLILISNILTPNSMLNESVRQTSMANLEKEDIYRESLDVVNRAIQQTYPNWNPKRDIGLPIEEEVVSSVSTSSTVPLVSTVPTAPVASTSPTSSRPPSTASYKFSESQKQAFQQLISQYISPNTTRFTSNEILNFMSSIVAGLEEIGYDNITRPGLITFVEQDLQKYAYFTRYDAQGIAAYIDVPLFQKLRNRLHDFTTGIEQPLQTSSVPHQLTPISGQQSGQISGQQSGQISGQQSGQISDSERKQLSDIIAQYVTPQFTRFRPQQITDLTNVVIDFILGKRATARRDITQLELINSTAQFLQNEKQFRPFDAKALASYITTELYQKLIDKVHELRPSAPISTSTFTQVPSTPSVPPSSILLPLPATVPSVPIIHTQQSWADRIYETTKDVPVFSSFTNAQKAKIASVGAFYKMRTASGSLPPKDQIIAILTTKEGQTATEAEIGSQWLLDRWTTL